MAAANECKGYGGLFCVDPSTLPPSSPERTRAGTAVVADAVKAEEERTKSDAVKQQEEATKAATAARAAEEFDKRESRAEAAAKEETRKSQAANNAKATEEAAKEETRAEERKKQADVLAKAVEERSKKTTEEAVKSAAEAERKAAEAEAEAAAEAHAKRTALKAQEQTTKAATAAKVAEEKDKQAAKAEAAIKAELKKAKEAVDATAVEEAEKKDTRAVAAKKQADARAKAAVDAAKKAAAELAAEEAAETAVLLRQEEKSKMDKVKRAAEEATKHEAAAPKRYRVPSVALKLPTPADGTPLALDAGTLMPSGHACKMPFMSGGKSQVTCLPYGKGTWCELLVSTAAHFRWGYCTHSDVQSHATQAQVYHASSPYYTMTLSPDKKPWGRVCKDPMNRGCVLNKAGGKACVLRKDTGAGSSVDGEWGYCTHADVYGWTRLQDASFPPIDGTPLTIDPKTMKPSGHLCKMPFVYQGDTYHECAAYGKGSWCVLREASKTTGHTWGYCTHSDLPSFKETFNLVDFKRRELGAMQAADAAEASKAAEEQAKAEARATKAEQATKKAAEESGKAVKAAEEATKVHAQQQVEEAAKVKKEEAAKAAARARAAETKAAEESAKKVAQAKLAEEKEKEEAREVKEAKDAEEGAKQRAKEDEAKADAAGAICDLVDLNLRTDGGAKQCYLLSSQASCEKHAIGWDADENGLCPGARRTVRCKFEAGQCKGTGSETCCAVTAAVAAATARRTTTRSTTTLAKAATHTEAGCECKDVSTCDSNELWENKRWCYSQPSSTAALCETQGWDFCKKEVAAMPPASTAVDPIHVLFIGNSLTFANRLPDMLARVSGGRIKTTMFAQGGKTLSDHFEDTNKGALNKVRGERRE